MKENGLKVNVALAAKNDYYNYIDITKNITRTFILRTVYLYIKTISYHWK